MGQVQSSLRERVHFPRGGVVGSKLSRVVAGLCLSLTASVGAAQECLGLRSLKYSTANLSLSWRVMEDADGPETRLIFGREHAFGGLRAGLLNVGNSDRAYTWVLTRLIGHTGPVGDRMSAGDLQLPTPAQLQLSRGHRSVVWRVNRRATVHHHIGEAHSVRWRRLAAQHVQGWPQRTRRIYRGALADRR